MLLAASSLSLSSIHQSYGLFSDKYDSDFSKAGERYLSGYDWRWFKAQGYQESLLEASAVSHAGAMGIMQIMPGTWREETERLGIIASPFNPKVNIRVGVFYMKRMVRFWKAPRPDMERLWLAFASYNAGAGNILKAQTLSRQEPLWKDISPHLKNITGRHSNETITYVRKIRKWYKQLLAG
jgi:membrane-bound lytic murein transglycosylase F